MMSDMTNEEMVEQINMALDILKKLLGENMVQGFICIEGIPTGEKLNFLITSSMTKSETCGSMLGFVAGHIQDGHGPDAEILHRFIEWAKEPNNE